MGFKSDSSALASPYGFQIELVGVSIGVSIWVEQKLVSVGV
jgi:hypothetical protein